jgi:hypothetical protein
VAFAATDVDVTVGAGLAVAVGAAVVLVVAAVVAEVRLAVIAAVTMVVESTPRSDAAATAPKTATAANPPTVEPIVSVRRRATARSRSAGLRRVVCLMPAGLRVEPFRPMTPGPTAVVTEPSDDGHEGDTPVAEGPRKRGRHPIGRFSEESPGCIGSLAFVASSASLGSSAHS